MYPAFFGLTEPPFAITPDPRYLYLSTRHADALAHLLYGINEAGGFIQLTGEVGTGKTTTIRTLLVRAPENAVIALLLNPHLTPTEFLKSLNQELGLEVAPGTEGTKELIDSLNRYLLSAHAAGRRVVLIIDEAQNLAPEVLEQVRLLTNLETASHKLLQIILIGQPELRTLLGRSDLRQLAQRVTARYHLQPLSRAETADYVRHRLRVAGASSEPFSAGALREVYRLSRGVPRVINVICDRAMLGAYTQDRRVVSAALVRRAAAEVFGRRVWPRYSTEVAAALPLLLFASLLWVYHAHWPVWPVRAAAAAPIKPTPSPPPPPPSLTELLRQYGAASTPDAAFAGLLQLWNVPYTAGGAAACTQASEHGLECESMHGSLAELRELNRPAVLTLSDVTGTSYSALVLGVGATAVSLRLGDQQADVSIAELSRFWFGDFVLLWHPSIRPVTDLAAGMQGPAVQQLRALLTRWNGNPADDAPGSSGAKYDRALVQLVEQFQRAHHLAVDGIAGLDTQLLLDSSLPAPATPLLQPVANSQG